MISAFLVPGTRYSSTREYSVLSAVGTRATRAYSEVISAFGTRGILASSRSFNILVLLVVLS